MGFIAPPRASAAARRSRRHGCRNPSSATGSIDDPLRLRAGALQHGRAADPHVGGARSARARPAVRGQARGVRAAGVPRRSRSPTSRSRWATARRCGRRRWRRASLQELTLAARTIACYEIGTGSGYLTALLASVSGDVTQRRDRRRACRRRRARGSSRLGFANVRVDVGDGARGFGNDTYDVIVLTGSTPLLPERFFEQLDAGRAAVRRRRRRAGDDGAARAAGRARRARRRPTCSRRSSRRWSTPRRRRASNSDVAPP